MSTEPIMEPCPWCRKELYDAVIWDADHQAGVCPSCRRCVTVGHDCEDGRRMHVTLTVPLSSLEAAVDAVIFETLANEFTVCRNLDTLVAECGGGCEAEMSFLRAARDAGVDIGARVALGCRLKALAGE